MLKIDHVRYYAEDGRFHRGAVLVDGERIAALVPEGQESGCDQEQIDDILDGEDAYLIPGLIDTHFHGCMQADFCDADAESMRTIADYEASQGITSLVPATMSYDEERLMRISHCYREWPENESAEYCGIHMEGPFIQMRKAGAQNPAYIQNPNAAMYERLQEASGHAFKIVTMAPELEGSGDFIKAYHEDTALSLGHSDADYDCADAAFGAGMRRLTHCCNAMNGIHHRKPGPIAAAADHQDVWIEMICDGVHLHPAMVRLLFRLFGDERIVLISDSMEACGLADGEYSLGGQQVTVRGREARLADGTLAGSVSNLMDCLRVAVKEMSIPLESAVRCATINPARSVGIDADRGSIAMGKRADLLLLDEELNLKAVYIKGQKI